VWCGGCVCHKATQGIRRVDVRLRTDEDCYIADTPIEGGTVEFRASDVELEVLVEWVLIDTVHGLHLHRRELTEHDESDCGLLELIVREVDVVPNSIELVVEVYVACELLVGVHGRSEEVVTTCHEDVQEGVSYISCISMCVVGSETRKVEEFRGLVHTLRTGPEELSPHSVTVLVLAIELLGGFLVEDIEGE
jgi:hypothetical protein